jgi:hypothetical protein
MTLQPMLNKACALVYDTLNYITHNTGELHLLTLPQGVHAVAAQFTTLLTRIQERAVARCSTPHSSSSAAATAAAVATAAARCLDSLAGGRGRRVTSVHRFGRALRGLSMQWTCYSQEECSAVGQLLDGDCDGIITLQGMFVLTLRGSTRMRVSSVRCAAISHAHHGSVHHSKLR